MGSPPRGRKEDIINLCYSYRLNIFGFPSAPGIPDLNLGLVDQRKAIEWARDNITTFGGDPKRITIFGESAGSRAVDSYAYAWADAKDLIVNGFISESGSAPWTTGNKNNPDLWYEVSTRLGYGGAEKGNATVACNFSDDSTPVVDEKVIFSDYNKRSAAGRFIQKPLLIGNNDNESGLQVLVAELQGKPMSNAMKLMTNLGYQCSARIAAQVRVDNGINAWRYRWMGVFPNQRISKDAGAWHGSEIAHIFGNANTISTGGNIAATENQLKVSELMNSAWAAFAKDPEKGLLKVGWPTYKEKEITLVLLAENNGPGAAFVTGGKFNAQCNMLTNNLPSAP